MRRRSLLVIVAFLCPIAGCFPARFTVVPEITGRVVDADGNPVPGAAVTVTKASRSGDTAPIQLQCDSSGHFYRKAEAPWGLYIVPMDPFGLTYEAVATANGKCSKPKTINSAWTQVRFFGLGAVRSVDLGDMAATTRPIPAMGRDAALRTAEQTVRSKVTWEPVLMNTTRKVGRWEFMYYSSDNTVGSHALVTVNDDGSVEFMPGH